MKTFNIIHRETIKKCLPIWRDDLGPYDHSTLFPHIFQANLFSQAWESFIKEVMTGTKFSQWKNKKMVKDWQARGKAKTWVWLYLYKLIFCLLCQIFFLSPTGVFHPDVLYHLETKKGYLKCNKWRFPKDISNENRLLFSHVSQLHQVDLCSGVNWLFLSAALIFFCLFNDPLTNRWGRKTRAKAL